MTKEARRAKAKEQEVIRQGLADLQAQLEEEFPDHPPRYQPAKPAYQPPPPPEPAAEPPATSAPERLSEPQTTEPDEYHENNAQQGLSRERPPDTTVYAIRMGGKVKFAATARYEDVYRRLQTRFGNGFEILAVWNVPDDGAGTQLLFKIHTDLKDEVREDNSYDAAIARRYLQSNFPEAVTNE